MEQDNRWATGWNRKWMMEKGKGRRDNPQEHGALCDSMLLFLSSLCALYLPHRLRYRILRRCISFYHHIIM